MYKKHNKRLNTKGRLSRRDFLQLSGLGFASAFIPIRVTRASIFDSPATQRARAQAANTLRVAFEAPVTLDPAAHSTDSEVALANAVYDYLIDITPTSEIRPRLARAWSVSEDGLTWMFELNEGVKWHDGSDFSADDVIWTFNRLRDPDQSGASDLLGAIDEITADGNTVVFQLSQPNPDFLHNLSDNRALILKADTEDPTNFIGTGPFKMDDFRPEDRAVLSRNEDYYLEGQPAMEGLEFIYFGDTNAAVNALEDGAVDVVLRMPTPVFLALEQSGEFNTIDIPTNGYNNIRLRQDRGLGTEEGVWHAFRLAVDRRELFELISFGFGAEGKDNPIGPGYAEYYLEDLQLPERDVDGARQMLADAGYSDGVDIELFVPNSGDRPDLAVALRSQLADAGIRVDVKVRDEGIYYSPDDENNWLEADFGITGWGHRSTPQQNLELSLKTGAVWNESHFSDPEVDALIELAGTSLDQEERVAAYQRLQQVLVERGPLIIPYFFPQFAAVNPSVDGVEVHPFAGRSDFRKATRS